MAPLATQAHVEALTGWAPLCVQQASLVVIEYIFCIFDLECVRGGREHPWILASGHRGRTQPVHAFWGRSETPVVQPACRGGLGQVLPVVLPLQLGHSCPFRLCVMSFLPSVRLHGSVLVALFLFPYSGMQQPLKTAWSGRASPWCLGVRSVWGSSIEGKGSGYLSSCSSMTREAVLGPESAF